MVAGVHGDDGGCEVGFYERVVVAAHGRETHSVLVDERGGLDGVVTREGVGDIVHFAVGEFVEDGDGVLGGVVGVVRLDRCVAGTEEKSLDGVREADVVRGVGRCDGRVGLERSDLHLLDKNVAGSTAHALTLVVGYDGVVGPYLNHIELRRHEFAGHIPVGVLDGRSKETVGVHGVGDDLVLVEQVLPVAEDEVDAHLVVRERSCGQSHTTVARVEQRKREVDNGLGDGLALAIHVGQVGQCADHLVVAIKLARRCSEGTPEVKVHRCEGSGDKVIEGDRAIGHQVVREVGGPTNEGLTSSTCGALEAR